MVTFILTAFFATCLSTKIVLNFETAKALTIAAGTLFLFSATIIALQRKKEAKEIMEALKAANEIEVDEPYAYAAFQEWLLKQGCDAKVLEGKRVVYKTYHVSFPFKAPEKVKVETTVAEDHSDFAEAYAQSHGTTVAVSSGTIAAHVASGATCLTVKAAGKTIGGAFYCSLSTGELFIHTLSRLPHICGGKVLKKVIDYVKRKGKTLILEVYKDNPVFELYKKEGFKVVSSDCDSYGCIYKMSYQSEITR